MLHDLVGIGLQAIKVDNWKQLGESSRKYQNEIGRECSEFGDTTKDIFGSFKKGQRQLPNIQSIETVVQHSLNL